MTLAELQADPSFERHPPEPAPSPAIAAWVKVAGQIIATPRAEVAKLDGSEREARVIGLQSLDDYRARKAVRILTELPKR